jgi:hypothetical protein
MSDRPRLLLIVLGAWRRLLLMLLPFVLTGCGAQVTDGRWRIWVWIVILVLLAAVTVLLISAIVAWQKRMARVRYRLEIHNSGNIASRYALQAEAPEGGLDFLFMLRGMVLSGGTVARGEQRISRDASRAPAPRRPTAKQGKGFLNLASTISGLLISVGNLLPYDVGVHFIRIGSKMRRGQGTAERMGRVSGQMSRQVGEMGGTQNTSSRPKRPTPAESSSPPVSEWVETPSVAPGETLMLELQVSPQNPYRAQRLSCVLRSRSLEPAADQGAKPNVVRHDVESAGLTPFQTYSPFLLLLMGVIGVLVAALMLIGG